MTDKTIDAPTSRRELKKQDRRQAIVEAARESFLEKGYAGTSMSGLLTTLGGSKATLWGYFPSKEELFAAVVEDISGNFRAELGDALRGDDDLEPALVRFCTAFLRKISSPEGLATWRLVVAESGRFPEVGKIFHDQAASHTQRMLRDFLQKHVERGELADETSEMMGETLINLCVGQQTRALWGLSSQTGAEPQEVAKRLTRLFLKAYRTKERGE